jgi:hypothetical protein
MNNITTNFDKFLNEGLFSRKEEDGDSIANDLIEGFSFKGYDSERGIILVLNLLDDHYYMVEQSENTITLCNKKVEDVDKFLINQYTDKQRLNQVLFRGKLLFYFTDEIYNYLYEDSEEFKVNSSLSRKLGKALGKDIKSMTFMGKGRGTSWQASCRHD